MLFRPIEASGQPVYLQLKDQVRLAVETGLLVAGEQLPGIRGVAEDLAINPNTVAKAYRELEHEGLLELRQGAGAFVAKEAAREAPARHARAHLTLLAQAIGRLRGGGLGDDEISRLFAAALTQTKSAGMTSSPGTSWPPSSSPRRGYGSERYESTT